VSQTVKNFIFNQFTYMYVAKTVLLRVYPYRCNQLETVIIFIKSVR